MSDINTLNLELATIAERDMWRDKAQAALARVAELEAEWKALLEETGRLQTTAMGAVDAARAAEAREAKLRGALVMAKQHMIVNDLSLPNVFAVIDAALEAVTVQP